MRASVPSAAAFVRLSLLWSLCALGCGGFVLGQDTNDFSAIDAFLQRRMEQAAIPGIALAIVRNDHILHLQGFGVADAAGTPITPQTPFLLGSVSKSFTALAIMQLVEAGHVNLEVPVRHYLPWFRVADSDASGRITIHHLLNQTSGLSPRTGQLLLTDNDRGDDALERHVRALSTATLSHPVGAVFQYSNANYIVLGMVIQAISGESYEQYIEKHIFGPLRMQRSFTSPLDAARNGLATGHRLWFGHPVAARDIPCGRGLLPSGHLISTAEDLAHYLVAHLNGGRYEDSSLLSKDRMAQLYQPTEARGSIKSSYDRGWVVKDIPDIGRVVWHGGDLPHFHAEVWLLPESGWGVALLMNMNTAIRRERFEGLGLDAAKLLLGHQPLDVKAKPLETLQVIGTLLLPVFVLVETSRTARYLCHCRRVQNARPKGLVALIGYIAIPALLYGLLASLVFWALPRLFDTTLRAMLLGQPDLMWILVCCGIFGAAWAIVRTAWTACVLRANDIAIREQGLLLS
jgi:CubicO group peptidase (beta-lactamase class C family)